MCHSWSQGHLTIFLCCCLHVELKLTVRGVRLQDAIKIGYRPVHDKPLDDEMEYVPPKARTY